MSVIRQDPTTKDWVIISKERGTRPEDDMHIQHTPPLPTLDSFCPFCPGQEHLTPPEVWRFPKEKQEKWNVRVFGNKFPALHKGEKAVRQDNGPLFREMKGVGRHEVIVETRRHNQILAFMNETEVKNILIACQTRYLDIKQDPQVKSVMIFKNHGTRAGTSLNHPHCQIVGTPIAPLLVRRKYELAMTHFDDTGRCLYCDIVEEEQHIQTRILFDTDRFITFHPFASRVPFETWIVPKIRQSSFGHVDALGLAELARTLRNVLRVLHDHLGNPDYNLMIHSSPPEDESKDYFLWHIQILPRMTTIAGFELGSGIFINTMLPEDCATLFRASIKNSEWLS